MRIIFFLLLIYTEVTYAQVTLKGHISSTGEPLPGAIVYFPDLKNGTTSRQDGNFEITNLPKIKTVVQVKLIGYKTVIRKIDLATESELNVEMEEAVIEANEVVVTGLSKATEMKRNPVPMVMIDSRFLQENTATNIIDAISNVPGVNAISTGPNVSKPIIRGLGYNRILTLFDGVRQESQQWGDEHGIEVDQNLIDRIEVVKGPASLIYGSDALAGVVNLIPANPLPDGEIRGGIQSNYQTNNLQRGGSVYMNGNQSGFLWGFRSSYKEAVDFKNKYDGRVYNTGYKEQATNLNFGLNRKWGYTHLNLSYYDNRQEIPDGSRDSSSRKFTKQINEEDTMRSIVGDTELNSYSIHGVHQRVRHYRVVSSSNFILGQSKLSVKLAQQQSIRQEFSHPKSLSIPGLNLNLNTSSYDVKYFLPEFQGWETSFGLNGMYQLNKLDNATEFVIPQYKLLDIGPFLFIKKSFERLDLLGGVRYDTRFFNNADVYVKNNATTGFDTFSQDTTGAQQIFQSYKHKFEGASASLGMAYKINDLFLIKMNTARGYRAPNISEISAKGVHPGTGFEQLGDANLKPEFSLQQDLGIFFENEHVSASAEMFFNQIENYIFNQKLTSLVSGDSIYIESGEGYPVFKFIQTKAQLFGGEASIDIHPHPIDWLHIENSISMVYAQNLGGNNAVINDSNKYLPFIPPLHTTTEVIAEFKKGLKYFKGIFAKAGMRYYATQNRVYLENGTETITPSYLLFDLGFGGDVITKKGKTVLNFGVHVTNLLNQAYQSNMSRLKYFDNYPVNGTGRSGIYSMGRNISFKLTFPLNIKS